MKVEGFVKKKYKRLAQKIMDAGAVTAFIAMIGLIGSMDADMTVDHSLAVILLGLTVLAYVLVNADRVY